MNYLNIAVAFFLELTPMQMLYVAGGVLWYLIQALTLFVITFVFYAAVIKFRELRDSGKLEGKSDAVIYCIKLALWLGLILDWLLDWFVLTIYFRELPREILTTSRIKRWYWSSEDTFNKRKAVWFADNFLLLIDPKHMGKGPA